MKMYANKDIKRMITISFVLQMVYLGYICFMNILRTPIIAILISSKIKSKVFLDVPYLAGAFLTTLLMIVWYFTLGDIINKKKQITFVHGFLLFLSFYFFHRFIPAEMSDFQYSYVQRCSREIEELENSPLYASVFSGYEKIGTILVLGSLIFLVCAFLIYWSICKYETIRPKQFEVGLITENNDCKEVKCVLAISFILQMIYIGFVCYINLFRKIVGGMYYFSGAKIFPDISYLLGAFGTAALMLLWYHFLKKVALGKAKITVGYSILLGGSLIAFCYVIPYVASWIQVTVVEAMSRNEVLGATYSSVDCAHTLARIQISTTVWLLYASICLVVAYVLCWAKTKYEQPITEK
ncbi:MAG: hypothetical protein J6B90_07515 [Lachnospiraceae bacterium]|nr:hypothetical protein [Lachnospiraceae bacterium]